MPRRKENIEWLWRADDPAAGLVAFSDAVELFVKIKPNKFAHFEAHPIQDFH